VRSFALIFYTCQLCEQDENGIICLNIDFLICIKSIVLWPNLGKMTTNLVSAQLLRNRWAEWCVIFRYDRGYDRGYDIIFGTIDSKQVQMKDNYILGKQIIISRVFRIIHGLNSSDSLQMPLKFIGK
jgi:hypothetical protein